MDKRVVEFIRTLRAAGVRISVAESADAMDAMDAIGLFERTNFRDALKTTLVKEKTDVPTFEHFFPLFFDTGAPPMFNMEQELTPDQQEMLQQALQSLMGNMDALQQLIQQMMRGQPMSQEQMDQLGDMVGLPDANSPYQDSYYQRMMQRAMGMQQLQELLDQLREELEAMGMSEEAIDEIMEMMESNRDALADQIQKYVGSSIAKNLAEQPKPEQPDIMQTPFQYLTPDDVDALRDEVKRLAARLRSRAALRQKRAKDGNPDPKGTIRSNLRYAGVPIEIKYRDQHLKPRLALICDISTSMRYCSEFMLTLLYELQDQVAKTRSFIFIDDMHEISQFFNSERPEVAVQNVLDTHRPGSYNTNLGNSLQTFFNDTLDAVDARTTVIILGDGRNNYNDPRLDLAYDLRRRARRLLWFNPEPEHQWGTGDSDMHQYAPISSGVFQVRNMAQLVDAIDRIMTDR
ncbi:MAG: VWA domain-containing protein [Anaerolineae bacterium]|nr:VWA domain-containing protein [Anaerolineae bacterium]